MRIHDTDDHDIRTLIERGSSTWTGPSPSARQARWAAEERPRRWVSLGMAAAGFGIAALLTGSVTLVATSQSPSGAATSVMRLVSHVFTTPPGTPAATPPPPASAAPGLAGGPSPSGVPPAGARTAHTPTPRWVPETHRPTAPGASPQPSPSGSPGPTPFPNPSPTDE